MGCIIKFFFNLSYKFFYSLFIFSYHNTSIKFTIFNFMYYLYFPFRCIDYFIHISPPTSSWPILQPPVHLLTEVSGVHLFLFSVLLPETFLLPYLNKPLR